MRKWIAVYTRPRHEKSVARKLEKKGIESYLPTIKECQKWSDRKKWVELPLFRSYVFVKQNLKNKFFILQTPGVTKVVHFGKNIAIVRDEEIQAIKLMIDGGFTPQVTDYFIRGDRVEVKEGPLKGIIGEVIQIDKKNRLMIKVEAIQHSISVSIDLAYLNTLKAK